MSRDQLGDPRLPSPSPSTSLCRRQAVNPSHPYPGLSLSTTVVRCSAPQLRLQIHTKACPRQLQYDEMKKTADRSSLGTRSSRTGLPCWAVVAGAGLAVSSQRLPSCGEALSCHQVVPEGKRPHRCHPEPSPVRTAFIFSQEPAAQSSTCP